MAEIPDKSAKVPSGAHKTPEGVSLDNPFIHGKLVPTAGWFVALGCGVGILTASTQFGKIVFGILSVALLYQISQWLQGK